MGKQSGAAAVFEVMYVNLVKGLIADELGEELYEAFAKTAMLHQFFTLNVVMDGRSDWSDDVSTAGTAETLDQAVVNSFTAAVAFLTEQLGYPSIGVQTSPGPRKNPGSHFQVQHAAQACGRQFPHGLSTGLQGFKSI